MPAGQSRERFPASGAYSRAAQATAVGRSVEYVDCDQVQAAATAQYNTNNDQRLAGVAQSLSVERNRVLACSGGIAAGNDVSISSWWW